MRQFDQGSREGLCFFSLVPVFDVGRLPGNKVLNCVGVAGRGERVRCFMEGQGVDGLVGDDCLCPCSALNVKVVRNSKQARTNDRSNHNSQNGSHVCSECQSGSKQARVNGKSTHEFVVVFAVGLTDGSESPTVILRVFFEREHTCFGPERW